MTDKVQKILEEVERLHNLLPVMDGDNISVNYADRICTALKMYIDSLQKEPVSEELEKEIDLYFAKWLQGASDEGCFNPNPQLVSIYDCHRIARHFAAWKEQQMMAKAIEGIARPDDSEIWCNLSSFNLKDGDKVRVVVIKED
jgi:hypothetical protein